MCLLIAILPVIITSVLLVQEGATLYNNIESGKLDVAGYIEQFKNVLPPYFQHLLDRFGPPPQLLWLTCGNTFLQRTAARGVARHPPRRPGATGRWRATN